MKLNDFIVENPVIGQHAHEMHEDHQLQMLREECYHIAVNAVALHKLLKELPEGQQLDAWAAEKITLANDYIKTVTEWLEYEVLSPALDVPMFDPVMAESAFNQAGLNELDKKTIANYVPRRAATVRGRTGLAGTNPNKAQRIVDRDIPRALDKLKDPNYAKRDVEQSVAEGDVSTSNLNQMYNLAVMAKQYTGPEGKQSLDELIRILKWYMEQGVSEDQLDEIGDTPAGRAALQKYQDKAGNQVDAHWQQVHNKSHLPTDPKMAKRNAGTVAAGNRIHGFGIAKNQQDKVTDRFDYRDAVGKTHVYQKNDPLKQGVAEGGNTYSGDVQRAFPNGQAPGVRTGAAAPKGTSTMPRDPALAKGQPVNRFLQKEGNDKEFEIPADQDPFTGKKSAVKPVAMPQPDFGPKTTVKPAPLPKPDLKDMVKENATSGASAAGSVGTFVKQLGEMPTETIKRQKSYTNQRTPGGPVKLPKQAK